MTGETIRNSCDVCIYVFWCDTNMQRLTVTTRCKMDLRKYPLDSQVDFLRRWMREHLLAVAPVNGSVMSTAQAKYWKTVREAGKGMLVHGRKWQLAMIS